MDATSVVNNITSIQNALHVISILHLTSHLWPKKTSVNDCPTVVDFIVVGAGSAGCVIAARLAEAKFRVLLIEAGDDPPLESTYPGLYSYMVKSSVDWNYTLAENHNDGHCHKRGTILSRGKMIGGTGSINGLIYNRGSYEVYDKWAKIAGDDSWRYENLIPFFKMSEDLRDPEVLHSHTAQYHGTDGPIKVIKNPHPEQLDVYLEAYEEVGHKIVLDTNGYESLGITYPMLTIDEGQRSSSAYEFLSKKRYPNLYVSKNTLVTEILFDDDFNAVGVKAITENDKVVTFRARKEVILSAGVFNSAQLLMLSGIGPQEHLYDLGIDVKSDLPVGLNLHDHFSSFAIYCMEHSDAPPPEPLLQTEFPAYALTGNAALNKSQNYPDYQIYNFAFPHDTADLYAYLSYFFNFNDGIVEQFTETCANRNVLYNVIINLNPISRGSLLLRSTDPKEHPFIDLGTFSDKEDIELLARHMEDFIRIGESSYFKSVGAKLVMIEIPGCQDLEKGSHEYWLCYVRCVWGQEYHYVGTCALGSVVDSKLKVFGVNRLRVADSSVMPVISSGNTNIPTYMIGEKAAHMIINEHC